MFNQNRTVSSEIALSYIFQNLNEEGTGLDMPCPAQKDADESTFTYDGSTLTIIISKGDLIKANALLKRIYCLLML